MTELPDWFMPPLDGWSADDLDRLPPDAPRHLQIIDGALVVAAPQTLFHMAVISTLTTDLRAQAPAELAVVREMMVLLGRRQVPEPDLAVVNRSAVQDLTTTRYPASEVVLAVEVVSADSLIRDTERKPELYAAAGIPHFWIVDREHGTTVVRRYELDPVTGSYVPTGVHRDQVRAEAPFPLELDLSEQAIAP